MSETLVKNFLAISEQLLQVLQEESRLLVARDNAGWQQLHPRKESLSHLYAVKLEELKKQRHTLKALSPSLKQQLTESQLAFANATQENMRLIQRARRASMQVMNLIKTAVEEAVIPKAAYSAKGKFVAPLRGPAPSLTLNTVL